MGAETTKQDLLRSLHTPFATLIIIIWCYKYSGCKFHALDLSKESHCNVPIASCQFEVIIIKFEGINGRKSDQTNKNSEFSVTKADRMICSAEIILYESF